MRKLSNITLFFLEGFWPELYACGRVMKYSMSGPLMAILAFGGSHTRNDWIKKVIPQKLIEGTNNQVLDLFPDPVSHFGAPWWPSWILQVVRCYRRWASAFSPLGWCFLSNFASFWNNNTDLAMKEAFGNFLSFHASHPPSLCVHILKMIIKMHNVWASRQNCFMEIFLYTSA